MTESHVTTSQLCSIHHFDFVKYSRPNQLNAVISLQIRGQRNQRRTDKCEIRLFLEVKPTAYLQQGLFACIVSKSEFYNTRGHTAWITKVIFTTVISDISQHRLYNMRLRLFMQRA